MESRGGGGYDQEDKWFSTMDNLQFADIINALLYHRILPLQLRTTPMWAQKPEDASPLTAFFRSTLDDMWTKLMKLAKDKIPKEGVELSFEDGHDAPIVSVLSHAPKFLCFILTGRF